MALRWLPLVAGLIACGERSVFIMRSDAASVITARRDGDGWEVQARSVASGAPLRVDAEAERLYVLLYSSDLAAADLEPGTLPLGLVGTELPTPSRTAVVERETVETFDGLPQELGSIRIATEPCLAIDRVASGALAGASFFLYGVAVAEDRSLIATDTGFFWADADGVRAAPEIPPELAHGTGFFHEASQELWTLDPRTGAVHHGRPGGDFVRGPDLPSVVGHRVFMDGSRGSAPLELFVLTSSHALYRFDGQAWVERAPATGQRFYTVPYTVAWAGPGQAVAMSTRLTGIIEDNGTRVIETSVEPLSTRSPPDQVRMVRYVEGSGVLLGGRGAVYSRSTGRWDLLTSSRASAEASVIERLGEQGLVYGGEDGVLDQYQPGATCQTEPISDINDAFVIAWLPAGEDRLVVYGTRPPVPWQRVALRRVRPR